MKSNKLNKKKYIGIITSFVNLKKGLLQIHENLIKEISDNFDKVYLINDQNLRLFPKLAKKIYLEDFENENIDVPYKPKNFELINPKNTTEFDNFCKDKDLVLINNIGKHFFDLKTLFYLQKNNVKLIQVMNLGVMKTDKERPKLFHFIKFIIFHFNQTIFKKVTVLLSNFRIIPKIEIRFMSDKTVLKNILKSSFKKFLYHNKFLYIKEIIEVNSRTYDFFLNTKLDLSEDYIVHLDANLNHRHEIQLRGKLSEDILEKHYFYLNRFLDKLSQEFNKKIIVTIHPAYDLNIHKKYMEDFEIVKYKTRDFISKAFLVTHFDSSAITDAIFLKKRVMSLESNYMSQNEKIHSRYYSTKVGYLHQNLEDDYNFDKDEMLKILNSNIINYDNFIKKFHIIDPNESGTKKIVRIIKDRFF